jgi:outer membrane protein assembly factor BamB
MTTFKPTKSKSNCMKKLCNTAISIAPICLFFTLASLQQVRGQTTMFRGLADHNYSMTSNSAMAFNSVAWKFNAEAPIRSTVAVGGNAIFFGSSKGVFYCLNKSTGKTSWTFNTGFAIHSSAALDNGDVFFSDNKQSLYSLNANTGKVNWQINLGVSKSYDWAYDYYYSSPTVAAGQLFIGSKDGCLYDVDELTGKVKWKFRTGGIVRSSPAVADNTVYVGDTEGSVFAINIRDGKENWRFQTNGNSLKNEEFGFDRRAIIASPMVSGNKVIVGSRDGFLYAIDKVQGNKLWEVDHQESWIISSAAVKDGIVVAGTSDGHFVEGLDLNSGKQLWKFHTTAPVWSSPCIYGDQVYIGSFGQGILYCLDLKTGAMIDSFLTGGLTLSSPVISRSMLYIGTDNGYLYALKPDGFNRTLPPTAKRYVFWEAGRSYYRYGTDIRIKRYLSENGYLLLDRTGLVTLFRNKDSAINSVVVFANNLFPPEIAEGGAQSLLRSYLNNGGKVVVTANNPVFYKVDPKDGSVSSRSYLYADSVLSIRYGPDDLRSQKGDQPAFATKAGNMWGLRGFWAAPLSLPENQVDIVLGKDENGLASAWVKKYNPAPGSGFVQIWINENTTDMSSVAKVAEYGLR